MRLKADPDICCAAGMCALTAPAVFDQDESIGTVVLLDPTPPPAHQAAAAEAVSLCPSGAIELVEP